MIPRDGCAKPPAWVVHAEKGDGGLTEHEREVLEACPHVRVVTLPGTVFFLPNEAPSDRGRHRRGRSPPSEHAVSSQGHAPSRRDRTAIRDKRLPLRRSRPVDSHADRYARASAAAASAGRCPRHRRRCVTARTRVALKCPTETSRCASAAVNAGASGTSKATMLVSTVAGSIVTPGSAARPSASRRARAWSSASRSTWWSSA